MRYDIIVLGGGPAGLSAAVAARGRNKSVLVVGNRWQDSPLARAERVDNYLGMPGMTGMEMLEAFQRHAQEMGVEMVFVLGHKEYYPRHGFKGNAEAAGYPPPYPIEDIYADCWMYQFLSSRTENLPEGKVKCADAMDKPEYWRE